MHPMALVLTAACALHPSSGTPASPAEPKSQAIVAAAAQAPAETGGDTPAEPAAEDQLVRKSRPLFGGVAEVVVYTPSAQEARAAFGPVEAAFDEMRRIEILVDEEDASPGRDQGQRHQ